MKKWAMPIRFSLLARALAGVLHQESKKGGRGSSADFAASEDMFDFASDLDDALDFARNDGLTSEQREVFHACYFLGCQPRDQAMAMTFAPPGIFDLALAEARIMERKDTDDFIAKRGRWESKTTMNAWANGLPASAALRGAA